MIDELLRRIAEFHRSRPVVSEFPMVVPVLDALDEARSPADIEPHPLPVVRHLDAVEPSGDAAIDAVLEEFVLLAPVLPWRQTVGYLDVLSQDYLDNYGYVQLLGPNSIVEHPAVRVGIGLWARSSTTPPTSTRPRSCTTFSPVSRRSAAAMARLAPPGRETPSTTRPGRSTARTSAPHRPCSCTAGPEPSKPMRCWWTPADSYFGLKTPDPGRSAVDVA